MYKYTCRYKNNFFNVFCVNVDMTVLVTLNE